MGMRISVVGLGKLGSCMAAGFARGGAQVFGVDVDPRVVAAVNAGRTPNSEPGLEEAIRASDGRLVAGSDCAAAVAATDVTFVIVPTPSDPNGAFSVEACAEAFRAVAQGIRDKDGYHLVVLTSTVLPGSTRAALVPLLEAGSGKRFGRDFGVCYSPAFIALGSVLRDFLNPDVVLIGESDERAGARLEEVYRLAMQNDPPYRHMSIENAELTKLALNAFVTMKISFANMIAELCERLPGGDVDVVTGALGFDRRVGKHYLKGGLGYGGPCFPRDNVALAYLARSLGTYAPVSEATDAFNRALPARTVEKLRALVRPGATVGVLGLAYKPGTPVIEESPGVDLALALAAAGARVVGYDPMAGPNAKEAFAGRAEVAGSLAECLSRSEVVLVALPDPAYLQVADKLPLDGREIVVVDFWRLLADRLAGHPAVRYIAGGRSLDDRANAARLVELWATAARLEPEPAQGMLAT